MTFAVLDTPQPTGQNIASSSTFGHSQRAVMTPSRGYSVCWPRHRIEAAHMVSRAGHRYPVGGACRGFRAAVQVVRPIQRRIRATPARVPWAAAGPGLDGGIDSAAV